MKRTVGFIIKGTFLAVCAVLAGFLGTMQLQASDSADVWSRFREGEAASRQANELLGTDPEKATALLEKAALCFQAVHRDGGVDNGKLFYNLGNIFFRLGDIGRAILNYRRAERFIPTDVNLQQNLSYARSRRIDKIEPMPQTQVFRTLFFWHYDLGGSARAWLLAVASGLLWLFASLYLVKRRPWLRSTAIGCAVISAFLVSSLALEAYEQSSVKAGVILEKEVVGRKGDGAAFEPTFKEPLHAGVEFTLVEQRKGWFQIELADGRRCWIPDSAAEII
ncbi:MAG: hypothetical protein AB9873_02105 [Syntrophobacteraceae bacterium]